MVGGQAKVRLPAPEGPAPDQGALPFMSLCASKLDSKMGDAAIRAVFEGNKVSAEDFLTSPLTYTSDPDLMFSIGVSLMLVCEPVRVLLPV